MGRRIPPQGPFRRIQPGEEKGHEAIVFKVSDQMVVQRTEQTRQIVAEPFDSGPDVAFGHGHEQGGGDTVAAHVADHTAPEFPLRILERHEIVIIAAGRLAVTTSRRDVETGDRRRPPGQQMLLDFAGHPKGLVEFPSPLQLTDVPNDTDLHGPSLPDQGAERPFGGKGRAVPLAMVFQRHPQYGSGTDSVRSNRDGHHQFVKVQTGKSLGRIIVKSQGGLVVIDDPAGFGVGDNDRVGFGGEEQSIFLLGFAQRLFVVDAPGHVAGDG